LSNKERQLRIQIKNLVHIPDVKCIEGFTRVLSEQTYVVRLGAAEQ